MVKLMRFRHPIEHTTRRMIYRFSHLNPDRHPNSRSTTIASERLVHSEKLKEN